MLIYLETQINASRDIDFHERSMQNTNERLVAGVTSGLIGLGDFLTRESKHFGVKIQLSSKITQYKYPSVFVAEQLKGPFKRLHHTHIFEPTTDGTLMIDKFDFDMPLG
jgi:ligand-binding SRPBCC domain-containing protein